MATQFRSKVKDCDDGKIFKVDLPQETMIAYHPTESSLDQLLPESRIATRAPVVLFLLFLLFVITPLPSLADTGDITQEMLKRGRGLIEVENYTDALEVFQELYQMNPEPKILFNIAMCQKALSLYSASIKSFKKFLELEQKNKDSNQQLRELAEAALSEQMQLVGKLRITEAPDGAEVKVDVHFVATLPLEEPLLLDPGQHTVTVRKEGYKSLETDVSVTFGSEVIVRAQLDPETSEIEVLCDVIEATVYVDGDAVGGCPYEGELVLGSHEIKIEAEDKRPFVQQIDIVAKTKEVLRAQLEPLSKTHHEEQRAKHKILSKTIHRPWLRISGWTAIGLGVAGGGLGIYYKYQWDKQYDVGMNAIAAVEAANTPGNESIWKARYSEYLSEEKKLNTYKTGIIVSYTIGGALMLTGAIFVLLDALIKSKNESIAVMPIPGGLAANF